MTFTLDTVGTQCYFVNMSSHTEVSTQQDSTSQMYAISVGVTIWDRSVPKQTSFHVAWMPTFYLCANVQGILSEEHAAKIARNMFTRLGHDETDVNVHAVATSMLNH